MPAPSNQAPSGYDTRYGWDNNGRYTDQPDFWRGSSQPNPQTPRTDRYAAGRSVLEQPLINLTNVPPAALFVFVGFSDDGRLVLLVVVLFVFFILFIVVVGMSGRHRVGR